MLAVNDAQKSFPNGQTALILTIIEGRVEQPCAIIRSIATLINITRFFNYSAIPSDGVCRPPKNGENHHVEWSADSGKATLVLDKSQRGNPSHKGERNGVQHGMSGSLFDTDASDQTGTHHVHEEDEIHTARIKAAIEDLVQEERETRQHRNNQRRAHGDDHVVDPSWPRAVDHFLSVRSCSCF